MSHRQGVFQGAAVAKAYSLYRPRVRDHVTNTVLKHAGIQKSSDLRSSLVVDVGCGSGQFTQSLAKHFKRVLGFDISEAQIEEAKRLNRFPHVSYGVSAAETLPVEDGSVDLLSVASAIHWFDLPAFTKEVGRVLKPGGSIAVVTSYRKTIHHENPVTEERLRECIEKYMETLDQYRVLTRQAIVDCHENLQFPSFEMKRDSIGVEMTNTAAEYMNYVQTVSFSVRYAEQNPGTTLFDDYRESLRSILQSGSKDTWTEPFFQLTWWYDIIMARKPSETST